MPWEARYLAQERLVETVYSGVIGARELRDAVEATARLGVENRAARFLGDLSGLQSGHSIVDLSEVVGRLEALGITRNMREALLVPGPATPDAVERARFYETACRNRGWNIRIFTERAAALAWLAEP
jgi:hypothetical protein